MNLWVKKSFDLAKQQGYLDKLASVYPVGLAEERVISPLLKSDLKEAFGRRDNLFLIETLLKLPRFPIDDPYVASLRKFPDLLKKNPTTINRIAKKFFSMDYDSVIKLAATPKSGSRQLGASFKNWLKTLEISYVSEGEILSSKKGVLLLSGSDAVLGKFAKEKLKVKAEKGLDMVLKVNDKFVVAEAKFLSDYGGSQDNQFNIATNLAESNTTARAICIAVLDGVVWLGDSGHMSAKLKEMNAIALSSLLLSDFIKSLS